MGLSFGSNRRHWMVKSLSTLLWNGGIEGGASLFPIYIVNNMQETWNVFLLFFFVDFLDHQTFQLGGRGAFESIKGIESSPSP